MVGSCGSDTEENGHGGPVGCLPWRNGRGLFCKAVIGIIGIGRRKSDEMSTPRIRPGPKFEITLEMAIANLRTVATRLGVTQLSSRLYGREGSFNSRTLEQRWGWARLCTLAGLLSGGNGGRRKRIRKPCMQQCGRMNYSLLSHCRTCWRRIQRQESETRTDFTPAPFE